MQAAMMRLGTLVYLYGRGRPDRSGLDREDRSASYPYPIPPPVLDSCIQTLCVSMSFKCHINQYLGGTSNKTRRSTAGACADARAACAMR